MTRNTVVSDYKDFKRVIVNDKDRDRDTTEQQLKDHILLLETITDCDRCRTKFRELRSVLKE